METETIIANQVDKIRSKHNDQTLPFDLPALIESMKQSYSWVNKELNALILSRDRKNQVILTTIHDGTEIESFQSKDSITFRILQGKLRFHSQGNSVILNNGQVMTYSKKTKYRLTTNEDTIFLLSISDGQQETFHN